MNSCPEDADRGGEKCGLIEEPSISGVNGNYCDLIVNVCGREMFIGLPDPSWEYGCFTFGRLKNDEVPDGELYANLYEGDTYRGGCVVDKGGDGCTGTGGTASYELSPRLRCNIRNP